MLGWTLVLVLVSVGIITFLVILFFHRLCFRQPNNQQSITPAAAAEQTSHQNGIAKLHQVTTTTVHHQDSKRRTNHYYVFRRGSLSNSNKPLFNWSDNPSLITDAVENGWSRFAFASYTASPSLRSSTLLGSCGAGGGGGTDSGAEVVEISWEVCQGSADFMQKIRLNPTKNYSMAVIKSALPLPGPQLGNSSAFPQEAYFEITILGGDQNNQGDDAVENKLQVKVADKAEGEKIKLINQESPVSGGVPEERRARGGGGGGEKVVLSVGLTASGGGSAPLKFPGCYVGSIGFNSTGSVFLDGIKLVSESENEEWGTMSTVDKVIGCGYNPGQKKVFFTVDSQLIHEVHCKSEEFGTPLYPTLAANGDTSVLVNFGQSVFKYAPANQQRTPNPCFIGPMGSSPSLGYYEDSKELFSMGRIDSQWLNRSSIARSAPYNKNGNSTILRGGGSEYDEVSDGDLFEIVLDSTGRSPHTPM